jgi:hypothetical protein
MTAARPVKSLLLVSTRFACAVLFILATVGGTASALEPAPKENPPASAKVDCSKAKLTGKQFLDMFHAIAMHGDLSDIPFIEKTLQMKITRTSNAGAWSVYEGGSVTDGPISVSVSVKNDGGYNLGSDFARADFELTLPIIQCSPITRSQFHNYFGGGIVGSSATHGSMKSIGNELNITAANGGKIRVGARYDGRSKDKDPIIYGHFIIFQSAF